MGPSSIESVFSDTIGVTETVQYDVAITRSKNGHFYAIRQSPLAIGNNGVLHKGAEHGFAKKTIKAYMCGTV